MKEKIKAIIYIIKNFNYKKLIIPGIFFIIYVLSFIYFDYRINKEKIIEEDNDIISLEVDNINEETIEEIIYVDIKGEVKKSGVYKITTGSRVNDLIELAGGLTKNANTRFINLSKVLSDGDVVVIYSNSEIDEANKKETIVVETPCICEEVNNDACIIENVSNDQKNDNDTLKKVNINTSTLEELKTLTGIGESKAKSIIEYREKNGNFKSIEELVNVSGISETIYSKIKENITV